MISICVLYPELLGTYGDGGNAVVLARRLRWRGIDADIVEATAGQPAPSSCDVYLLGGGEDGPQSLAVTELDESRALHKAVERGAAVLAVCAGLQLLGSTFADGHGRPTPGLALIDAVTIRGAGARRVGEVVSEPAADLGLPPLTGYENHQGVTRLGAGVQPLGHVRVGRGNDAGDFGEGALAGHIVGTYLHGPVLARNPALADVILSWVAGPLPDLDDTEASVLRSERIAAAGARRHRWR